MNWCPNCLYVRRSLHSKKESRPSVRLRQCIRLTPWSRILLEKLTGFQLVNKFPTFYGTQRFITALTSVRHLSLSWSRSIHFTPPSHFWRYILFYTPIYGWVFQVVSFPQVPTSNPESISPLPHTCYMPQQSHSSRFDHPNNIWWGASVTKPFVGLQQNSTVIYPTFFLAKSFRAKSRVSWETAQ